MSVETPEGVYDPIVEETLSAIRQTSSAHDVIRVTAHGTRIDNERYHDIVQVMKTAAAIDESAAAVIVESDRQYRQALSHIGRRLRDLDALKPGLTHKRATDTLWFYFGREAWHLLVTDRHWSWNDAEQWLSQQWIAPRAGASAPAAGTDARMVLRRQAHRNRPRDSGHARLADLCGAHRGGHCISAVMFTALEALLASRNLNNDELFRLVDLGLSALKKGIA